MLSLIIMLPKMLFLTKFPMRVSLKIPRKINTHTIKMSGGAGKVSFKVTTKNLATLNEA